ncbi:MAG: PilZ domain-containing protein [Desulfobacteraceae bacterium]|nr:PilZ domain-containing protein [Desulfobacteraceae bacterium]
MIESGKMGWWQRIKRFFAKTQPGEKSPSGKGKTLDQRNFDRYCVSFPIMVSGNDPHKQPFEEKSRLRDVSGSGALFISSYPGRYFPGQLLRISIQLDAADDVRARIYNEASVVRVHPPESVDDDLSGQAQRVAIKFRCAFDFERLDAEKNGFRG